MPVRARPSRNTSARGAARAIRLPAIAKSSEPAKTFRRLGESGKACRQGQHGTLHPQGTARDHRADVGYGGVNHRKAGPTPPGRRW
jgi:hypothetical protein